MSGDHRPREFTPTPVRVPLGDDGLVGELGVPPSARGIVLFAQTAGRRGTRHRHVARTLDQAGFGTLLIDLLTEGEAASEERTARLPFDIGLLAGRLVGIINFMRDRLDVRSLPIGLFGAGTGAAAALVTAASRPHEIAVIVSCGGRPDLGAGALSCVAAPTLLIVGGLDTGVIQMNRDAMARMPGEVVLDIVPGATHFEEPGAIERVAVLAAGWFSRYLEPSRSVHAHTGHASARSGR